MVAEAIRRPLVGRVIPFKEVYLLPYPSSLGPSPATCKNTRKKSMFWTKMSTLQRPQEGWPRNCLLSSLFAKQCNASNPFAQTINGATRTSTSTRIRRLGCTILERGAISRSLIVDVNEDSPPWALNSQAWWSSANQNVDVIEDLLFCLPNNRSTTA